MKHFTTRNKNQQWIKLIILYNIYLLSIENGIFNRIMMILNYEAVWHV
jgi:hypothetical protein